LAVAQGYFLWKKLTKGKLTMQRKQQRFEVAPEAEVTGSAVPTGTGKLDKNIGIEAEGGAFIPIIQKETEIPCLKTQIFSTAQDNQDKIQITIFYGESSKVVDNQQIGVFVISEIPPEPRGGPQIEVGFHVSTGGTFTLKARDVTGKSQVKLNQIKT
jgi:molecular chaperone DnaK (HSP70)